jgi:formate dehydrogenase
MLERSDFTITHQVLQVVPHVQWTPAVVPPAHERREEWRTFADLAEASGTPLLGATAANALPRLNRLLRRLPGRPELTPDRLIALLLRWGRRTSMRELRRHPEGVLLPRSEPGTFLGRRVRTADGLVHLAPPELVADAARLDELEAELSRTDVLRLVGRRDRRSHNSWMHGNPRISQPAGGNTVLLHPQDAVERGIAEGDTIEVSSPTGSVRLPCSLTEDVARGVVVVPHGWGHATSGHPRARSLPGANVNDVIPGGPAHMDPVSGQAVMLAHAVEVRRVLVGDDTPTPDEALPA